MTTSLAILLGLLLTTLAGLPASDSDAATVKTPPGKAYVYKQAERKALSLEVYLPKDREAGAPAVPGIVLFHGGGWSGGTLDQFRYACQYYASRGLVAATVEYRMLTTGRQQTADGLSRKAVCITDAKSAIRWLKQHAAELGLDPKRLVAGGGSAGGHIAVLATSASGLDDPQDPPDIDTSVVAWLLFNPAFSPDDRATPEVDVQRQLKAPVPPAIIFFGTKDETWKPGGDALLAQFRTLGDTRAQLWLAEGQKHGFFNKQPWLDLCLGETDRFLTQLGLLSGAPAPPPPACGQKLVKVP